jgi:hypothetical protein
MIKKFLKGIFYVLNVFVWTASFILLAGFKPFLVEVNLSTWIFYGVLVSQFLIVIASLIYFVLLLKKSRKKLLKKKLRLRKRKGLLILMLIRSGVILMFFRLLMIW